MTSVLPVVLAVPILLLVSHPGDSAMSGRVHDNGHREVGRPPRLSWLASEAQAHLPARRGLYDGSRRPTSDPETPDDLDDLLERAKAGEAEAFGELFDHFHGLVFRQLLAQTRSRALAEDLTSETFLRALRAVGAYSLPSRLFVPWLRRIARNLAADHFKSSRTRLELVTADLSFYDGFVVGPEDLLIESLDHAALREALLQLPPNQRRAIALRFLRQLSITETALELGCTEGAAKQLQWRGLRNLARLVRDERDQ